jgi:lipopolysaccharide transport system ATP-binding protein
MSDEVLVQVEGVSKKFCRSLKRSLWYGVKDVSSELLGRKGGHDDVPAVRARVARDQIGCNVASYSSFELKRGECLGLIGPNGAGKSTLLKMLNGLVKPDQGRITMRGQCAGCTGAAQARDGWERPGRALIELGAGLNP